VLRLPQSPRKRRRLAYAASALGLVAVVAIVSVAIGNSSGPKEPTVRSGAPQRYRGATPAHATAAEKRAAARALTAFAASAIPRRDLETSWRLATPHLRTGTTHAEWLAGNLPVVPYPARDFGRIGLTFTGAYQGGLIDYDVLVLPRTKRGKQQVYSCELDRAGSRWLVDYCYPRATLG
jgi:hypothetical protein